MSQTFERIIREQQAEIDHLRSQLSHEADAWVRHNDSEARLMASVFRFLRNKADHDSRYALMQVLIDMGYCLTCERKPCECDELPHFQQKACLESFTGNFRYTLAFGNCVRSGGLAARVGGICERR